MLVGWVAVQASMLATIGTTIFLFIVLPKGLFPQQDLSQLIGFSEAPQDVSFKTMYERQLAINGIVQSDPDIANVVSFIGSGNGSTGNTGSVFVELKPKPPRAVTADQLIARLRPKLSKLVGVQAQRSWQDVIGALKDNLMRIDLRFGPTKKFDTVRTSVGQVAYHIGIRFQKCCEFAWQFAQGDALIADASTNMTRHVWPGDNLIGFG